VVWCNEAAARLVGLPSPRAAVGRPIIGFVAPETQALVVERITRMAATGQTEPLMAETFVRVDDGRHIEVEVQAWPVGGGTFLVVARDVTEQRLYQRQLAASAQRYRELFDQVPVGVWEEDLSGAKRIVDGLRQQGVTDLAGHLAAHPEVVLACARALRILDVNATALELTGARDKAELLANLHRVFLPESMEEFAVQLVQLASGRRETVTEGWNGTLAGGRRWVAVRGVVAAGHEQDWGRVVVTTTDLTERRQAAEERATLQERLRHAEKLEAVGRLAGGVAHDFNNVLAAILGFAEISLDQVAPGSELHEHQQRIKEAALRARDLVRQILTFGRRDQPEARPLDVPEVVGEALHLARASIPATVAIEAAIDPAAGVALADRTQLHQIVLNLCSNARDAVGAAGHIRVSVEAVALGPGQPDLPAGRYVLLRVRDDGAGMDAATRAHLFEPYLTTKARGHGHGLGLAVVHGIVSAAGGAIRVQSAPGQGSTFDVYLPRVETAPAVTPRPAAVSGGHERVLLVDDDPLVRRSQRRVLQSLGYQVTEATDGQEALDKLRAAPGAFDLVVTDLTMPRLSGVDLARALLAEQPAARVVLCTGFSDAVDDGRAAALGIKALLQKPTDRATLAATLRRALS
jgi:PAS domain S-box-containing protein